MGGWGETRVFVFAHFPGQIIIESYTQEYDQTYQTLLASVTANSMVLD